MEILDNIKRVAEKKCPCCRPVRFKENLLLINEPPISSGPGAHQRWLDLKDYLDTNYDDVKVIKNKYQLEVMPV